MIEVQVHQQLRAILRRQEELSWPHYLTMARLVARALRLRRSTFIQAGLSLDNQRCYRLSYLLPALLWSDAVILVAPESLQQRLFLVELPHLREWTQISKPVRIEQHWPYEDFRGVLLVTPELWIADRIEKQGRFPQQVPTIIDSASYLETWANTYLTTGLNHRDWQDLETTFPAQTPVIHDYYRQHLQDVLQRPENPYECWLFDPSECKEFQAFCHQLLETSNNPFHCLPKRWQQFLTQMRSPCNFAWITIDRQYEQFSLFCGPAEVASSLQSIWHQQPTIFLSETLDLDAEATLARQRLGVEAVTCLQFLPDRRNDVIHLYVPETLPLPNTPQFQAAALKELRQMVDLSLLGEGLVVVIVGDLPLKAQIAAALAAEFGSRVQVEKTCLDETAILVTGWSFWRSHQAVLPSPKLIAITTLPIPSLESPLVAGRVAYYKRQRQDWFSLYLLPEALRELQWAIAPIRSRQGVVAILDSRIIHRNYGKKIFSILSPFARHSYLDTGLFEGAYKQDETIM